MREISAHFSLSMGLMIGSRRSPHILYRKERNEIVTARTRLRRVCTSRPNDFQVQKEEARLVIDLLKEIRKYLAGLRFHGGLYDCTPTLIQVYILLNKCCNALDMLRKKPNYGNRDAGDSIPPLIIASLASSLEQVLTDLDLWLSRLNQRLRPNKPLQLHVYPLRPDDNLVTTDPQAKEMRDIIGGLKVTNKFCFLSLEPIRDVVLPYLSRRDHDKLLGQRSKNTIRKLLSKKKKLKEIQCHMFLSEENRNLDPLRIDVEDIKFGSRLGSGGFGEVFEVNWLGMSCAVKRIRCSMEELSQEANVQFRLRHPNIVQLFGVVKMDEYSGLVMERLDKNMKDYIFERRMSSHYSRQSPFKNLVAVDMMLQIARAMRYLHGLNIIHRDLKPHNILLCLQKPRKHGRQSSCSQLRDVVTVKLADFGLATVKMRGSRTETLTSKAGTAYYRAPEVLSHGAGYGLKADVYSFAVTSLEILTGKNLAEDEVHYLMRNKENWLESVERDDYFIMRLCSDLLQKCWDSDAQNRPSFQDICKCLEDIKTSLFDSDEDHPRLLPCCSF